MSRFAASCFVFALALSCLGCRGSEPDHSAAIDECLADLAEREERLAGAPASSEESMIGAVLAVWKTSLTAAELEHLGTLRFETDEEIVAAVKDRIFVKAIAVLYDERLVDRFGGSCVENGKYGAQRQELSGDCAALSKDLVAMAVGSGARAVKNLQRVTALATIGFIAFGPAGAAAGAAAGFIMAIYDAQTSSLESKMTSSELQSPSTLRALRQPLTPGGIAMTCEVAPVFKKENLHVNVQQLALGANEPFALAVGCPVGTIMAAAGCDSSKPLGNAYMFSDFENDSTGTRRVCTGVSWEASTITAKAVCLKCSLRTYVETAQASVGLNAPIELSAGCRDATHVLLSGGCSSSAGLGNAYLYSNLEGAAAASSVSRWQCRGEGWDPTKVTAQVFCTSSITKSKVYEVKTAKTLAANAPIEVVAECARPADILLSAGCHSTASLGNGYMYEWIGEETNQAAPSRAICRGMAWGATTVTATALCFVAE